MLLPGRGLLSHDHPGSVSTWDTPGSVSRSFLTGMTWARRRNKNNQHSVVFDRRMMWPLKPQGRSILMCIHLFA